MNTSTALPFIIGFFNDQIKLESVVPLGPEELSILTSQPFIRGRDAEQAEIDNMMREKGFERIGLGTFYHADEGLLVHDLVPKNVKVSELGYIHPIDPVIQRVTQEFANYLRRNPIVAAPTSPPTTPGSA